MLVLTSSDLWAPTQELAVRRYPLRRGWTLVRKLRRWYWAGSDRKYDEARQVERRDPLRSGLVPPGSEETDHSVVSERGRPSRQGTVGRTTKGEGHDLRTRAERPADRSGRSHQVA